MRQDFNEVIVILVFTVRYCGYSGCQKPVWADSEFCREHHPHQENYEKQLLESLVEGPSTIERRNFNGTEMSGLDLSGKEFRYCCFSRVRFHQAKLQGTRFLMCTLDEIEATDSWFTGVRMLSVMAAGADFSRTDFTGSDLVNCNFNGIKGISAIFDESDLFYSRFIGANLTNARFNDCNLKRVDFSDSLLYQVDFSDSNPEEAYIIRQDRV